jgi:hypothetical protein
MTRYRDLPGSEHHPSGCNALKSKGNFFVTSYGHVTAFFVKSLRWHLELQAGNC